ncbi:beta-ketoacyl synthase chain length factor [Chromobacterium haemolyticum]|uniref:Beta-ketoacyl synthase chain length factor n=2 Tax=Chromobacterium haemolyticum TaxID=394935 RepID=A0ABS3GSF1_9NEIS|nr:beta-ketoacyl synthase chain length factor [Chromobacterium haemolyticum]MBO0417981.1 beta-ketoacyl synthase chain length factor [Chromobacterium haemolyticum]
MAEVTMSGEPTLAIRRWAAWMPGRESAADWAQRPLQKAEAPVAYPDCRFVDASQRRRLSPLARICLHLAQACAADVPAAKLVFASRHGEVNRTHLMLEDIAADSPVSPTVFGLSVHNAIAGMLSLLRRDASAASAVAAGEQTLGYGLLEAALEAAADPSQPVLLLFADLPLLPFYQGADDSLDQPQGLALLLQAGAPRWSLRQDAHARAPEGWPQPAWLAHGLAGERPRLELNGWRLCREGT